MTLGKSFSLKVLLEVFCNIGSAKDKMLETGLNLERSMVIFRGTAKMLDLYHMLYDEKAGTVQTTLDKVFTKEEALILCVSNMFITVY